MFEDDETYELDQTLITIMEEADKRNVKLSKKGNI